MSGAASDLNGLLWGIGILSVAAARSSSSGSGPDRRVPVGVDAPLPRSPPPVRPTRCTRRGSRDPGGCDNVPAAQTTAATPPLVVRPAPTSCTRRHRRRRRRPAVTRPEHRPTGDPAHPGAMPSGSYMAEIQARGYLRAGVDQSTYLWGYRDPVTGALSGFDIDMLRQVSQAIFGSPDRFATPSSPTPTGSRRSSRRGGHRRRDDDHQL